MVMGRPFGAADFFGNLEFLGETDPNPPAKIREMRASEGRVGGVATSAIFLPVGPIGPIRGVAKYKIRRGI